MIRPLQVLLVGLVVVAVVVVGLRLTNEDTRAAPVSRPTTAALPPTSGDGPDAAWVRSTSRSTGIPARALTAYASAALSQSAEQPTCRIAWNTVAAIGATESSHGAFGGARLDAGGVAKPLIIGVALDGTRGNRAIRDTDAGDLDDDRTWDRAVGAMQFIPTTWARWGADGDGDGREDPHDIDDAALAAARYLCGDDRDLETSQGWSSAVLTYNQSIQYATKIARTATSYADAL